MDDQLPPRVERDQLRATLELGLLEVVVEGGASQAQDGGSRSRPPIDEVSIDAGTNASVRPPE